MDLKENRHLKNKRNMTVCIAAICDVNSPKILFCADRLVTNSNGLTFEQGKPKIDKVTDNCLIMNAGLGAEADEIINAVVNRVENLPLNQKSTLPIEEIAHMFKEEHQKKRAEKVNDEIMRPHGLTIEKFYSDMKTFPDWFSMSLTSQLAQYKLEVQFLVIGFNLDDENQNYVAKIFFINELGEVEPQNSTGFAIIGIGDLMSLPELTRETYNIEKTTLDEGMVKIYWAKRSAERVIGVGQQSTDLGLMYVAKTEDNKLQVVSNWILDSVKEQLKTDYDKHKETIKNATRDIPKHLADVANESRLISEKTEQPKTT